MPDAGAYEFVGAPTISGDALTVKVLTDLASWTGWLDSQNVNGALMEFGWPSGNPGEYWPGDNTLWNALGESYYDALQAAAVWSSQWGTSEAFATYELAPYTGPGVGSALNTQQAGATPLENHLNDAGVRRGVALTGLDFGSPAIGSSTFSNTNPGTVHQNYFANIQGSWNYIAAQGITIARVGFRWERLQPTLNGALNTAYLNLIKQQVTFANNAGVDVVLDMHNYGRYYLGTPAVEHEIGDGFLTTAHLEDVWIRASDEFAANARVVAYGIMNEPTQLPGGALAWENTSNAVCNAIRANGDNKLILVPGYNWAKVQGWTSQHLDKWITASNVRYEAHHYWDTASSIIGAEDSVYGVDYDTAVADLTTTAYVTAPKRNETVVSPSVTAKGVASTSGSAQLTIRVRNASNTVVHTQTATRSGRNWSLALTYTFTNGTYSVTAQQDTFTSPSKTFTVQVAARKPIALSAGPTNSWHGPGTNPSTGDAFAANRDMYSHRYGSCADFFNTVGVCSHVNYGGPYERANGNMDRFLDLVQEAGIRRLREGLISPATTSTGYEWDQSHALATKVRARNLATTDQTRKIEFLYGTPKEPALKEPGYQYTITNTNGTFLRPLDGPAGNGYQLRGWSDVAAFQGPNEPDAYAFVSSSIRSVLSSLQDGKNARTSKVTHLGTEFIDFRNGRIVPPNSLAPWTVVVGSPMAHANPADSSSAWDFIGDYSNGLDIDAGAAHVYWGGMAPPFLALAQQQWAWFRSYNGYESASGLYSRTLPMVVTETGYIVDPADDDPNGQRYVPPEVAAEYTLRTLGHNYMIGVKFTCLFSMFGVDTGGSNIDFGLVSNSFVRRPAFYAVKNQQALVGWSQRASTQPFNVTMVAQSALPPTTVDAGGYQLPYRTDKLVLGKDDNPDQWLIWLYPQNLLWDRTAQAYRQPAGVTWRLTLPAGNYDLEIAEPAKNPVKSPSDGQTYANPNDGTAYAPIGTTGNGFFQVSANVVDVHVRGLTRVIRVTRQSGDAPVGTVTVTGTKTSRRTLRQTVTGTVDANGTKTESKRHSATRPGTVDTNGTCTSVHTRILTDSRSGIVRATGTRAETWKRLVTFRDNPAPAILRATGTKVEVYSRTFTESRSGTSTAKGTITESWKQVDIYQDTPAPGIVDGSGTLVEEYATDYSETVSGTVTADGDCGESWRLAATYNDNPDDGFVTVDGTSEDVYDRDGDLSGELVASGALEETFQTDASERDGEVVMSGEAAEVYFYDDVAGEATLTADGTLTDIINSLVTLDAEVLIGGSLDESYDYDKQPVGRIEADAYTRPSRD